ncbi:Zn(II)2Cys6 transcription factor [Cladophialophora carrionii]|uniref:Zn(II)2Cys6 transcription factor n=1 Tax=Cladophialophora carrionii TaxID=86049 RepID=A0A1C1CN09_9EURO|nr:Zn(II)2Cys6 transcription factor [Cladophialophora carrionii]
MFQFNGSQTDPVVGSLGSLRRMSNSTKNEKRHITRNRTSYSCLTCRRRKVKCDKTRPVCGGCQKANEQCLYHDDMTPAAADSVLAEDRGPVWKKRKSSLAEQESLEMLTAQADSTAPPTDLKAIEEQLQRLTRLVDALRHGTANGVDLRWKELLTPEQSASDSGSEGPLHRPSMSLDMFQSGNHGSTKELADLSTPLSTLKLNNGEAREDPFWNHISDELDQLNHLMRRRDNSYAISISPENKPCDQTRGWVPPVEEATEPEQDDFWVPNDFHKEAGAKSLESLDLENNDPVCRMLAFSKTSLLQNVPLKCSPAVAIEQLTQGLPTRAQSNVLFRCWLSGVYPIVGIFLPSDIFQKHEEFWDDREANGTAESRHPNLDFLTALYAIWYAGSLSISTKGLRQWFPHASRARLSTQFHDHTVFCLLIGSFKRNISLYKLAALVLLQTITIAEEDPLQSSLYLALIVRLAFSMGLHREPTLFELSANEEGMRRRLWWQIIQLDIFNVVASGYPSQISEKFCDTRVVCEDRDAFTPNSTGDVASSHPNLKVMSPQSGKPSGETPNAASFRTLMLVARGKSILACALRSVVGIHLETKKLTNEDIQEMKRIIAEVGDHIHGIIKAIPSKGMPEMGFFPDVPKDAQHRGSASDALMGSPITATDIAYYKTSPIETDPSWPLASFHRQKQAAYNKWARVSLSMLVDKIHCVAYAPFLKNTKSKLWGVGRQCALHSCHSFLRKFISIATDPDLEAFRWSWPALYGPLHAVLIILVDLYERPASVEAPKSRELVDRVFGLAAPESGIVGGSDGYTVQRPLREGGVEAGDMLRGLRSAAWQRAGLDPTVLWTEEDQLAVGVATPLTETQKIAQSLREDSIYEGQTTGEAGSVWMDNVKPTEQGIRYMVKLTQGDFDNEGDAFGESFRCTRTARNEFLQGIERDARMNAGKGLARREGQAKMPFPLSGKMAKCSGKAAAADAPPVHVLDMHAHVPRPEGVARSCPSRVSSYLAETGVTNGIQSLHETSRAPEQPSWDHSSTNGVTHTPPVTSNSLSEKATNGAVHVNGHTDGYGSQIPSNHAEQSHEDPSSAYDGFHQGDTDMDLGFDWERWDAVFGQYSGFTDLMDDVTMSAWTEQVDV